MKEKKIYYAHHQWKYDSKIEHHEIEIIAKTFIGEEIINPNGTLIQENTEGEIMLQAFNIINECDIFVYSTLSGVIGKGLLQELLFAQSASKEIWELCDGKLCYVDHVEIALTNNNNNRFYAIVKKNTRGF